jgi:hypothetical protein
MPMTPWREQLFDPATTRPPHCRHCDTERKNLCRHDADWHDTPTAQRPRRPKGCINRTDPSKTEIPF